MVDDIGDPATMRLQSALQLLQGVLIRKVERQMIELHLALVRHPGWYLKPFHDDVSVLEKRHGLLVTELEEVVPEGFVAQVRDEPRSEHPVPEPRGGVHVVRDQGEVVDAPPEGPSDLGHRPSLESTPDLCRDRRLWIYAEEADPKNRVPLGLMVLVWRVYRGTRGRIGPSDAVA